MIKAALCKLSVYKDKSRDFSRHIDVIEQEAILRNERVTQEAEQYVNKVGYNNKVRLCEFASLMVISSLQASFHFWSTFEVSVTALSITHCAYTAVETYGMNSVRLCSIGNIVISCCSHMMLLLVATSCSTHEC